jgi:hypothetical protein
MFLASAKLVRGARLEVCPGADHGMCQTRKDPVNADLQGFVRS